MQYAIAMDHRKQYHQRHVPRTIDLVVVELARGILLGAIEDQKLE
jgi:hypothetical protein